MITCNKIGPQADFRLFMISMSEALFFKFFLQTSLQFGVEA